MKTSTQLNSSKLDKIVLDTSALIDGRVIPLLTNGYYKNISVVIPQCVLAELQVLADGRDSFKRSRAKRGLDNVVLLKEAVPDLVEEEQNISTNQTETDMIVLESASAHDALLCTTDFAQEQLAKLKNIRTLNPNALAEILRVPVQAGDTFEVFTMKQGESTQQLVGYLEDGTLVVIGNTSRKDMKKTLNVVCEKVLQTKSGRMIFAHKA